MGCDIHLHTEVLIGGKWHHWMAPSLGRNYELFGLMAGVRGGNCITDEPRGIPENLSEETEIDFLGWADCYHTASYLSDNEYKKCLSRALLDPMDGENYMWFDGVLGAGDYRKRVVFWFDS